MLVFGKLNVARNGSPIDMDGEEFSEQWETAISDSKLRGEASKMPLGMPGGVYFGATVKVYLQPFNDQHRRSTLLTFNVCLSIILLHRCLVGETF